MVLVRLGVLPNPEAADHDVIESNMEDTVGQVDITDLQRAQLTSACAGDRDQPQVQRQYWALGSSGPAGTRERA
jgi:hypothetical protein